MKKILLISACALCFAFTASAQFANSNRTSSPVAGGAGGSAPWSGIRASYGVSAILLGNSGAGAGSEFSASYVRGMDVFNSQYFFLELAPELAYRKDDIVSIDSGYDINSLSLSLFSVAIPANIVLKYDFGSVALRAHVGLNGKLNVAGSISSGSVSADYFKDNNAAKRLQLGLQSGSGIEFSNIYIGVSYHYDLTPLESGEGSSNVLLAAWRFTLGYNF